MSIRSYYLGAPMFANPAWRGSLYSADARPREFLRQYARVFNAVEGNSTFYGLPSEATVSNWQESVPATFRFCFKFPRSISHEAVLGSDLSRRLTREFLARMAPLRPQVGVLLLQLPPSLSGSRFRELADFLSWLPAGWHYAVEPRHFDFFGGTTESAFLDLLTALGINRALFDTADLHALRVSDADVVAAQKKKPRVPRRADATAQFPLLRYVGHNHASRNLASFRWLAQTVTQWLAEGRQPFIFIHAPDDAQVPELCQAFHTRLSAQATSHNLGEIPPWPGTLAAARPRQQELF